MKYPITKPWGKFDIDKKEWHPLIMHSLDVCAIVQTLLEMLEIQEVLSSNVKNFFTKTIKKRLCFFAGLHDIGKHNFGFQDQIDESKTQPNIKVGHLKPSFALLSDRLESFFIDNKFKGDLCFLDLTNTWFVDQSLCDPLFKSVVSHHGKPLNIYDYDLSHITCWLGQEQNRNPINDISEFLEILWDTLDLDDSSNDELEKFDQNMLCNAFLWLFSGLVQFADWVASNKILFPYANITHDDLERNIKALCKTRFENVRIECKKFFKSLGWLDLDKSFLKFIFESRTFNKILPFDTLHEFQASIFNNFLTQKGLTEIVEAQTGGGKTEIAILRGLQYLSKNMVGSIVFALPSIASARQIHKRIEQILEKAFPSYCPKIVLATGSDVGLENNKIKNAEKILDDKGFDLEAMSNDTIYDETDPFHILSKLWPTDSATKFLAGTIVICTIDQVLKSSLQDKHAPMIKLLLARSFLIVDEVHASDTYQMSILKNVLYDHRNRGGVSLLLSATLTENIKMELLGLHPKHMKTNPQDLYATPYPLLTQSYQGNRLEIALPKQIEKKFQVVLEHDLNPQALAEKLLDKAKQGARICVIKNTAKGCIAFQKLLEDIAIKTNSEDYLFKAYNSTTSFHAKYSTNTRKVLSIEIERNFDKNASAKGLILVATQVVQQSLDIDFDLMLSDLCPMDLLIQRAGRLHRHLKQRPMGFDLATLVVLSPKSLVNFMDKKALLRLGIGNIYLDLISLEATIKSIKDNPFFTINDQSRHRIESTLNPKLKKDYIGLENAKILESNSKAFDKNEYEGRLAAYNACYNIVDNTYISATFNDDNNKTRLSDDSVLVQFKMGNQYLKLQDVFSGSFNILSIPIRDLGDEIDNHFELIGRIDIERKDGNSMYYEFTIINGQKVFKQRFKYSRYGIEKL